MSEFVISFAFFENERKRKRKELSHGFSSYITKRLKVTYTVQFKKKMNITNIVDVCLS